MAAKSKTVAVEAKKAPSKPRAPRPKAVEVAPEPFVVPVLGAPEDRFEDTKCPVCGLLADHEHGG